MHGRSRQVAIARLCAALACAAALSTCGARRTVAIPEPSIDIEPQLAAADRLVRIGCFDCLREALVSYQQIAERSGDRRACVAAARTAGLLALRERVIGLVDQHFLEQAREADCGSAEAVLLDVVAAIPRRYSTVQQRAADDRQADMIVTVAQRRAEWQSVLSASANENALAAASALTLECIHGKAELQPLLDQMPAWRDAPVVQFSAATCAVPETDRLARLLNENPAFAEINYFLGLSSLMAGDFDGAGTYYQAAANWRQDWPAALFALGTVAVAGEDYERAAQLFQRTRVLIPDDPTTRLEEIRALSYSGRYPESLVAIDELIALGRWHQGEARYWRAWNEAQLHRNDEAWTDIQQAEQLLVTADVVKLAGILAVRRGDLPTALAKLGLAHARDRNDCNTQVLLGGVQLELRQWTSAISTLTGSVSCLDGRETALKQDLEQLRAKGGRERVIARREQELQEIGRTRVQSWFNLAVASLNTGETASARAYAERVARDERFGDRARAILERTKR
jgi:tetratricopeptide (TPR) repeat protein